jgi:PAS domain S-box-containing protein
MTPTPDKGTPAASGGSQANAVEPVNLRVLVIDDAHAIHEDFRKILASNDPPEVDDAEADLFGSSEAPPARLNFSVDSAHQGEEGLRLVQQALADGRPYAMAFVDVRMPPGWDGIETTARLWKTDPTLQVVLCTAYSDYSWEEMTARLGTSDSLLILKKPFDTVEVLQLAHALTKKWALTLQSKNRLQDLDRLVAERTRELSTSNQRLEEEIAERIRTEDALRMAQARLNYLVTQSPAVIYSLKTDGQSILSTWASEGVIEMTGYSAAEITESDWWATHVHPGDWDAAVSVRSNLSTDNRPATEYRLRHKNGQYRWIRDQQRLVRDSSNQPVEIVGTWMDITERKELEEKFRQAQKMEAVGQLAGGVAHDFNNLLLVMRGHAELLLLHSDNHNEQTNESLKQITAASERAANLTRQLLAFSRKQVMQSQPLLLNDLIANLTKMLKRIIGEHIQLQCHYASQLSYVEADPGMLEQILVNLVVNARDAMSGGGKLLVTTEEMVLDETYVRTNREATTGRFVCLSVNDTGSGISPEHLPHIFEPFFTTKEVGKGTGLGLATVYGITKQHRGWIDVASQVGVGSTFRIFLPAMAAPPPQSQTPAAETGLRGGSETVLLVEDDEAVRSLTRRLLENFGYRVREAASGREALSRWSSQVAQIDLLLTDIIMPHGISGLELASQLRNQRPDLRVVFLSGYPADAAGKDPAIFRQPHTSFIQKPCPWRDLLHTVRNNLDAK